MTTDVAAELTSDQRWDAWKQDGVRRTQRRRERMKTLFGIVCIAAAIWMMFGLGRATSVM
jgi:hypothetical protein